ncbi:hypothetical protein [Chthonobacter rhizosphaerae]|uniref:hypothetical protein n=1 Tax=Chthonobacter rhizosphaerae TaxID=2735553 RepID=UPI0015EF9A86|nr:hypothetical protein [Chthonobacter rhizosphaerae]
MSQISRINPPSRVKHQPDPLRYYHAALRQTSGALPGRDVIKALAGLDPPTREVHISDLEQAGAPAALLRAVLLATPDKRPSVKDILVKIGQTAELFRTPERAAYARVPVEGRSEYLALGGGEFRSWLVQHLYQLTGEAPNKNSITDAITTLEAQALFDGAEQPVYVRTARLDNRIVIDLGDPDRRCVIVRPDGWRIEERSPVPFERAAGYGALPIPDGGGSIAELQRVLNLPRHDDLVLVTAWVLAALGGRGPFPVLVITGEQGASKSTFTEFVQRLVDPRAASRGSLPRSPQDTFIHARNGHVIAYDNVSVITPEISDTLCTIATGGTFRTRELFTNLGEVAITVCRPLLLNAIENVVTRPDLADRSIILELQPIPASKRRPEQDVRRSLEQARPRLLGALLDMLAAGLKNSGSVRPPDLPRMADFAIWASACEIGTWEPGTFAEAFARNADNAKADILNDDPVYLGLCALLAREESWRGTATELLQMLRASAPAWSDLPPDARRLAGHLRRITPALRVTQIEVDFHRLPGPERRRVVIISRRNKSSEDAEKGGS